MRNAVAPPSAADLYALYQQPDGRFVARPAMDIDLIGAIGSVYTRAEIEQSAIGASVTFELPPAKATVDGLSRGQAVALWAGVVGVLALIARALARR